MKKYKNYRIKEADYCDCDHVRGSHAGKHFGCKLGLMALIIIASLFIPSYLVKYEILNELESFLTYAFGFGFMLFIMFMFDKGCSFCTCTKFNWNGINEYEES